MNSTIKLHLDPEEFAPVARLARDLQLTPEDVVYAGLDRIMKDSRESSTRQEIIDIQKGRHQGLPVWADDARGVHIYESKQDE